jgi:hypothetical protein
MLDYLSAVGFEACPIEWATQIDLIPDDFDLKKWLESVDLPAGLAFYGLDKNSASEQQFQLFVDNSKQDKKLLAAVYSLHKLLTADPTQGWVNLSRTIHDLLPSLVILSLWKTHAANMAKRKFDQTQTLFHKQEVRDQIIAAPQSVTLLSWLPIYIKANMIKAGRLYYELHRSKHSETFEINLHIPAGGPLLPTDVDASLALAPSLIRQYFQIEPDDLLFRCHSWLLSPELDQFLSPTSNIRNFRDRFEIIEVLDKSETTKFLFGDENMPLSDLPEKTSLQKAVKTYLLAGGKLHDAIGILKKTRHCERREAIQL